MKNQINPFDVQMWALEEWAMYASQDTRDRTIRKRLYVRVGAVLYRVTQISLGQTDCLTSTENIEYQGPDLKEAVDKFNALG